MRIGVMISYRGSMKPQSWIDDTDNEEDCISRWENCANEMIKRTKKDQEHCQIEVFLFLRRGFWNDFRTLRNHLKLIHQNTWLSNEVYLVIDRRFGKQAEFSFDEAVLDEWFNEIIGLSFDDILQTDVENLIEYNEKTLEKLKHLVSLSRNRRKTLNELLVHSDYWNYEILWIFDRLKNFIGELKHKSPSGTSSNTIVILDGNWNICRRQTQTVLESIVGEKLIAVCSIEMERELKDYAEDAKLKVLKFSGYFDIRYFLHLYYYIRADAPKVISTSTAPFPIPMEETSDAEKSDIVFGNNSLALPKANLISSAFDPNNLGVYKKLLTSQASRSLFELFNGTEKNKFVLPIVTTDNLSEYLEEMPQNLLVWVHFGHGKTTGLQSSDGFFYLTDEWLKSFRDKGKSLRLAFFFSCESKNVAEKFAASGVKIAVGFEEKVEMEDCMKLAKIIVPLALSEETEEQIIEAFTVRSESLGEEYIKKCKPCIFFKSNKK